MLTTRGHPKNANKILCSKPGDVFLITDFLEECLLIPVSVQNFFFYFNIYRGP